MITSDDDNYLYLIIRVHLSVSLHTVLFTPLLFPATSLVLRPVGRDPPVSAPTFCLLLISYRKLSTGKLRVLWGNAPLFPCYPLT